MRKRAVLFGILIAVGLMASAQQGVSPLGLQPEPPPGLTASIWPERPQYRIGEYARIYFYVSQPAYVYIFDFAPDGKVTQLFPNYYSPNAYVSAGTHVLPDNPNWKLRVTPPPGTDRLLLIASTIPLSFPTGDPMNPYPLMGPTPDEGRARILGIVPEPNCGCYVTAWNTVEILPAYSYGVVPCPPCWYGPCPPCPGYIVPPCAYPCVWGWYLDSSGAWHMFIGECPADARICWYFQNGRWHMRIRLCFGSGCP
ncbi:DUF4384 domain-containing protein [Candidatus Bipolaricaulota bacterium]|nr:DUF4384 domain-containing protein [Candidatus Bipolaricaulota bacterium]